jgi:hypothetical protein
MISFDGRDDVNYLSDDLEEVVLAYTACVNKYWGSEYTAVIISFL